MPAWFEMTVDVPTESGETVGSLLLDLGSPGLQFVDGEHTVSLTVYFRELPPREDVEDLLCRALGSQASQWTATIRTRSIDEEDWAEGWKSNFRSIEIGHSLRISPPWDVPTGDGRASIIIEPAMAFGTGQHPTTRGCLELLEENVANKRSFRALDMGTGSGILAIALAKLGVAEVYAIDTDAIARQAAAANAARNNVSLQMAVDLDGIDLDFDLIVANLYTNLLREFASEVRRRLIPDGVFICSGFLEIDEGSVAAAYDGFQCVGRRREESWVTLAFRLRGR